ncbi:MAG: guanylate kinase [Saprospiraceae bacterium]|nr:guanylate kinase [Saprospiraceae bacterium]
MNKLLIITAPSGAGKTTIMRHLLDRFDRLSFSISATTRNRRPHEVDGRDYYFISIDQFKQKIVEDAFVEWQEVYENQYYGTLKTEVERLWAQGKDIVFDIDVKGALNLKSAYPQQSLSIFVKPPSREALLERLSARRTETDESLRKRLARADEELAYENKFDIVIVNDILDNALQEAETVVSAFIND